MFNAERVNAGCFFGFAIENELRLVGFGGYFLAVLLNEDVFTSFFLISVCDFAVFFSFQVFDFKIRNVNRSLNCRGVNAAIKQYFRAVRKFGFAGGEEFFKLNPSLGYGNLLAGFG